MIAAVPPEVNGNAGVLALLIVALFGGRASVGFVRGYLADRRRARSEQMRQVESTALHSITLDELSDSLVEQRVRAVTELVETLRVELATERRNRMRETDRLNARISQLEQAIRSGSKTVPPWPPLSAASGD